VLLVVVTASGAERNDILECAVPVGAEALARVATWVNVHGHGRTANELQALDRAEWPPAERRLGELLRRTLAAVGATLTAPGQEAVAMTGAGNLMAQPEFNNLGAARRLVAWLDHREALLHTLEAPGLERDGLRVVIGDDPAGGLPPLACVSVAVQWVSGNRARVGVVGPMRMAYARVLSLVGAAPAWVSRVLPRSEVR